MATKQVVFHIHAYGDATVGDGSHTALVTIHDVSAKLARDPEYLRATKESLADAFMTIFDAVGVRVQTAEEVAAEEAAET